MDAKLLGSLKAALSATPDNLELLKVVLRACAELGDHAEGRAVLEKSKAKLDLEATELASEICLRAGDPARAVELTEGAPPSIARARALLALDRKDEAASVYRAAIQANPTLEDADLRAQLTAKVREIEPAQPGRPRLRVIANDDTADDEVLRALAPPSAPVRFADVGGLEDVKKQIHRKIILPFQKPSIFERFRKKVGGGILLFGPPGCGKTLLARATAGECNAQFLNVSISDILDMYIGESERKLHAIFEKARSSAPSVLFFDELEGLAGKRQFSREGTSAKLVSQFLSEMDGFAQNNSGVLILGATNVPWAVDAAFRRPGRFDRLQFIPPPDRAARESILKLQMRDRPAEGVDYALLATRTQGFSGADLEHLVETAADLAIEASLERGKEQPLQTAHFKAALEDVRPTTLEWLTTARNYARYANEGGQYDEVLKFIEQHGK
jgi:transitional endoplasmic reticulum ATPase